MRLWLWGSFLHALPQQGHPAGFQGVEAASLHDLVQTAQDNLTKERAAIRITNPALTVDDMNKALQQAGGSYILCQLSEDGTAITFTPKPQGRRPAASRTRNRRRPYSTPLRIPPACPARRMQILPMRSAAVRKTVRPTNPPISAGCTRPSCTVSR